MTPDNTPARRSPEELETEAAILDAHGNLIEATECRQLAAERRAEELGGQQCL